jgi:hypothetical protein
MTLSIPIKILLACFAVATLLKTAMSGRVSAGLKGSGRSLQIGSPKSIKKRNAFLIIKTGDGALIKRRGPTAAVTRTMNGNATAIIGQA